MGWTRASSIERALACVGSTVLEPGPDHRSASTLEAAAWGTTAHTWKQTGEVRAPRGYEKLGPLFTKRLRAAWGSLEAAEEARVRLWPEGGRHEASVAVWTKDKIGHPEHGLVVIRENQDQRKWTDQWDDNWVTGNIDYDGDLLGDPWISDLKTGKESEEQPPQLWLYSLARWLEEDRKPERIVTDITHWPRYPIHSLPERYWGEIEASDLDIFWGRLIMKGREREGLRLYIADGGEPSEIDLNTGTHCKYCPARIHCPALAEAHENGEEW